MKTCRFWRTKQHDNSCYSKVENWFQEMSSSMMIVPTCPHTLSGGSFQSLKIWMSLGIIMPRGWTLKHVKTIMLKPHKHWNHQLVMECYHSKRWWLKKPWQPFQQAWQLGKPYWEMLKKSVAATIDEKHHPSTTYHVEYLARTNLGAGERTAIWRKRKGTVTPRTIQALQSCASWYVWE